MKKIYQNPETKVVRVEVTHMIAASERISIGASVESASGAESRRGRGSSLWDDEDDEY